MERARTDLARLANDPPQTVDEPERPKMDRAVFAFFGDKLFAFLSWPYRLLLGSAAGLSPTTKAVVCAFKYDLATFQSYVTCHGNFCTTIRFDSLV